MIKANELRIGNLVTYNPNSVDKGTLIIPLAISCVDDEAGVLLNDGFKNCYSMDEILPIPLTPEILEGNFGLKKIAGTINEYRIGNLVLHTCLYVSGYLVNVYIGGEYLGYHSTVHSFQNLYHALTGEELEISF